MTTQPTTPSAGELPTYSVIDAYTGLYREQVVRVAEVEALRARLAEVEQELVAERDAFATQHAERIKKWATSVAVQQERAETAERQLADERLCPSRDAVIEEAATACHEIAIAAFTQRESYYNDDVDHSEISEQTGRHDAATECETAIRALKQPPQ